MTAGPRLRRRDLDDIRRLLTDGVGRRAFPGGLVVIGRGKGRPELITFGRQSYSPDAAQVTPDTVYDLASLTKVLATTAVAMRLVDAGLLDVTLHVRAYVEAFRGGWRDGVRVRHLLSHCSGLPWWGALYRDTQGLPAFLARICALEAAYPTGARAAYSDLGFILLGGVLEAAAGRSLDRLFKEEVVGPLALQATRFRPPRSWARRTAPTEVDPWRGRLLRAEVHDENAAALGGVAGHAGLFGIAEDLGRFASTLLRGGRAPGGGRWVREETLHLFTRNAGVPRSTYGLGWDTTTVAVPGRVGRARPRRTQEYSSAGRRFSRRAFGHTGFTGTSLWIDPLRDLYVGMLTNRVHPTRDNNAIREYRAQVADLAVRAHRRAGGGAPTER